MSEDQHRHHRISPSHPAATPRLGSWFLGFVAGLGFIVYLGFVGLLLESSGIDQKAGKLLALNLPLLAAMGPILAWSTRAGATLGVAAAFAQTFILIATLKTLDIDANHLATVVVSYCAVIGAILGLTFASWRMSIYHTARRDAG